MNKIIIIMLLISFTGCNSLSLKASKASIEVPGHKAEIEGLDLKTEKKYKSEKPE